MDLRNIPEGAYRCGMHKRARQVSGDFREINQVNASIVVQPPTAPQPPAAPLLPPKAPTPSHK